MYFAILLLCFIFIFLTIISNYYFKTIIDSKNTLFIFIIFSILILLKEIENYFKDCLIVKLENNINKLELLNPLSALKRGYAIVKKDNKCIQSIKQLKKDDKINLYISNGDIEALITNVKEEK